VLRFVDTTAAAQLVSYDRDREIIDRFTARPVATSVLLIVRHAKAGSRSDWAGDDADRPLSGAGRTQAEALAGLLALFGPDRIHSAPPLRCTATVAPLAARLDMAITAEPLLSEEGFRTDPGSGLDRLRMLAAVPGVSVVCSQGGVIPDAVAALTAGTGLTDDAATPDGLPARKASLWVLGSRAGEVVFADYYPDHNG
jgi:phosphohistidine phosphatase SixA